MTDIDVLIGKSIERHRKDCGMSQRELARRVALRPETVMAFEAGRRRANPLQLFQIADVLGIEVESFFDEENSAPTPNIFGKEIDQIVSHYDSLSKRHRSAIFALLNAPGRDPD